jgi:hypothetical protein
MSQSVLLLSCRFAEAQQEASGACEGHQRMVPLLREGELRLLQLLQKKVVAHLYQALLFARVSALFTTSAACVEQINMSTYACSNGLCVA